MPMRALEAAYRNASCAESRAIPRWMFAGFSVNALARSDHWCGAKGGLDVRDGTKKIIAEQGQIGVKIPSGIEGLGKKSPVRVKNGIGCTMRTEAGRSWNDMKSW